MVDLSSFDAEGAGNPHNNIFGLPFSEEESKVVILPVPWEVTVSYNAGTARAADHVCKASLQIDLYDIDAPDAWKQGFYMRPADKKILLKSDYLRKEAELYIDFISKGEELSCNKFMCKTLREINEGSNFLNNWVYEQTSSLLKKDKLVGLLGGDHSTVLGYLKAIAEIHGEFAILQIDAHADLRPAYQDFKYSHASIMHNALAEIPNISQLFQLGIRDYSQKEWQTICNSNYRIVSFRDMDLKKRKYEGQTWQQTCDEIVNQLPQKIYVSFDIDGLDPKNCPNTGTPVIGGLETEEVNYLLRKILASGKKIIGFDLSETGVGDNNEWDANVSARILWKLCNFLVASNN